MKTLFLCLLLVATQLVASLPVEPSGSAVQEQLPAEQQETLITLDLGDPQHDMSIRDKRTIGFLRQLFPGISQIIDNVIQSITRFLFRVVGRLVLRGGLLGGGGGGGGGGGDDSSSSSGGNNGRKISITLPTYPPGEDDEEEEDNTETAADVNPEKENENQLAGAASQVNEVRVQYTDPGQGDRTYSDQEVAASGGNENPGEAADEETDEEGRNKRFLNFGGDASASSSSSSSSSGSGSGGGSGNFLFDIIRLIAGSGNTDSSDDSKPAEVTAEKDDGYQAGIPGPITRLFIIANRGLANLMQDLILRLAQTSERIVNFKARLITSII